MNIRGSIAAKGAVNAVAPTVESESRDMAQEDRARLQVIHNLSKHIYEDTPKRNVRLLRQIHQLAGGPQ